MISFVFPSEENRVDVLEFYREFEEANGTCVGFQNHGTMTFGCRA